MGIQAPSWKDLSHGKRMKRTSFSERLLFQYICCFLILESPICSAASSFKPEDAIFLNCGALTDGLDADKRNWSKDSSASYSGSSSFSAQANKTNDFSQIPSGTARVFTSTSTYTSPDLSKGRHFLGLHFFPAYYNNLDPYNATFSVITGSYTLLENFNPATIATNFSQAYIMHEFYISISSAGALTLVFAPSSGKPNSFALINGIEITVPTNQIYPIRDPDALQTIVRLNVGGLYVSPTSDSGLSRTWYGDSPYIFGAGFGVSYYRDPNVSIRYSKAVLEYIAPPDVYGSARSMGPNPYVNLNYNLTWLITVDNGFRYLIRLHFCEIQSEFYKINQRVFDVFVNNMTADKGVDLIGTATNMVQAPIYTGVAVYKDYMVIVPRKKESGKQSDLWIELHPSVGTSQYGDTILNGLEVFKINETSGNVAGPNPDLRPASSPKISNTSTGHRQGGVHGPVIVGIAGVIVLVLVVSACLCYTLWRCQQKEKTTDGGSACMAPLRYGCRNACCRHFMLSEIVAATNNFDDALLLGVGGFGKVYRGEIDGGTKVAIKRRDLLTEHGWCEFNNEIKMLSMLRHCHLVSLIGYCIDSSETILVYNYMANGTFRQHIYGTNRPPLSWRQRLEICIGAAKGLHYLHSGAAYTLIHRDVKTTNILLDENWVAKVSDFGISKMTPSLDCSHVSTLVKGTFGYFDPEYFRTKRLTEKSDVYSFRVVLLEVLCARPALDESCPSTEMNLAGWAAHHQRNGGLNEIIDPFLKGKIAAECLHKFVQIVEKCVADRGEDRPSMSNVLMNLELALLLQLQFEEANEKVPNSCVLVEDSDAVGASLSATARPDDDC
ncbi:putative receptor-like protein kinase [Nymphaea thermarum]|nr:putative receptor-like protein kinase [Nymphaea thermarum]